MAYHGNTRGGLDFNILARGNEKSYSTSFLVDLEPDLLTLCSTGKKETPFDLSKKVLVGHTKRIFKQLFNRHTFGFGATFSEKLGILEILSSLK